MNRNEGPVETGGKRSNRLVGLVVFIVGWGLLAAVAIAWLTGSAGAATVSAKNANLTVLKATQAATARTGAIRVRVSSPAPRKRGKATRRTQAVRVTGTLKQAWSGRLRLKPVRLRIRPGARKVVRLKLSPAALAAVRNCGTPTLDLKAKAKRSGRARAWSVRTKRRLARQVSRCAVPKDVDLTRADSCEWIADPANPCLGTYPNDHFTRKDESSETGLRLDLSPDSTPATRKLPGHPNGINVGVESLNSSDGFSPGPMLQVKIPGLDNQAAFTATGLVGERDMSQAYRADQPALLIDAKTGKRQLIWTELDSTATTDAARMLILRVGKNLTDGRRYIVALRNLKDADGKAIPAPAGFRLYRDNRRTGNRKVESRRAGFEGMFRTLDKAGVKRKSLYLAWDFTVASTGNLTGRMTSIRDRAFADELNDRDLTDGSIAGTTAPGFEIDSVQTVDYGDNTGGDGAENIRMVIGTFKVPCYLYNPPAMDPGAGPCAPGSTFKLDADQNPVRKEGAYYDARFKCNIPRSAVTKEGGVWKVDHKVRPSLYGHGLFGSIDEVSSKNIRQLGTENGVMVCGTDWIGMSGEDVLTAMNALMDLTTFPALPDRLQQGFLNFLFLGRLMIHPDGFAADPNFRFDGESVIDTSDLFYYGNSQGGIAGGALTAVATDFTRSVLYVPAMNYSTMLSRSVDFDMYKAILYPYYPREIERPLIFSLMQTMWDRGEPNGYANHMTSDPLPGTPEHKVLIMMAYGDHQVANVATEVEARTIGAPLRLPAVSDDRLAPGMIKPWVDHETLGDLSGRAADGNGFFVWDIGPKRLEGGQLFGTDPMPLANVPPKTTGSGDPFDSGSGIDPHDTVIRSSPLARKQIADFIRTDGKITDPCGNDPCWAAGWNGMP